MIEPCCAPVLAEPIEESESEALAAAFKLLADPTRLRILSLVANATTVRCVPVTCRGDRPHTAHG